MESYNDLKIISVGTNFKNQSTNNINNNKMKKTEAPRDTPFKLKKSEVPIDTPFKEDVTMCELKGYLQR